MSKIEIGERSKPQEIDVNLLKEAPYNKKDRTRKDEEMHDLVASIKQKGVLQNLVVVEPENGDNRYEIAAGNRRWAAAKIAGKRTVPCVVISNDTTQSERRLINLMENAHRKDLTYQQEFEYVAEIMTGFNDNIKLVAEKLAFSVSRIEAIVAYGALPDHIKESIKTPDDYKNAISLVGLEPEKILETMKLARDKGLSSTTVENIGESLKTNPNQTPTQAVNKVVARGTKITVTLDGEWNKALTAAVLAIDTTRQGYTEEALKRRLVDDGFHPQKVQTQQGGN
jgi:ParB family transcriptional regulator, chromosome partitioning protein